MTTPAPYTAGPSPVAAKTNVISIVALVLSIIGFTVVGIILGFVGLNQVKKTGEAGRGLAIAAIVIGFIELVLGIILIIVYVAALASISASGY
ncbi:DUF4190 domain-containing protein [Subtercola frigoramans]|uniref:Membrane protease YdiL (CAAX protease family) n=1 Tax=Subtercola frigoramans TaxID=120298 RepID=A0ABS2L2R9_9MICO|nr:DUF4190 domain-containing protein [Subtercola frigoramans]MBM7471389.1 membrane protease YdiL (CAAX protease family) [Subtercola frigoramans]